MDLKGKVAVVTGASTGIGQAMAKAIAQKGARVALVGRNEAKLKETEQLIVELTGEARVFVADLRDENSINKLVSDVKDVWGTVDVVANVAGVWHDNENIYYGAPLHETPSEQINEVLDVNIRAPMLLTRLLIPGMVEKRQGKIINISGTFAYGGAKWLHYYVSKLAVEHFTIGLADELREHQIQVNCISPSDVATEALKKFFAEDAETALKSSDVADMAIFLICDEVADQITGQTIVLKNKDA